MNVYDRIYDQVRAIPRGKVATYGQIANLLQLSGGARQVGYALNALSEDSDVPWHRVVNAQGRISLRGSGDAASEQRRRLEAEGVTFTRGRISLEDHRWDGN